MFKIEQGSSNSLFTLIAVVIFGIFLSLSYWLFQDEMKSVLASVVDGVKSGTLVKIDGSLGIEPEVVLVPNAESDFKFTSSTGTITGYTGTRADVVIPSTIKGVAVRAIGSSSFYNKRFITSVYIPDGVTSIGYRAFRECWSIKSVRLPETLTSIGESAFQANLLTDLVIPQSVSIIGRYAFDSNKLKNVVLPNNLKSIEEHAFGFNDLTNIVIPDSVTSIGEKAFYHNQLTSVRVPKGVTNLLYGAFYDNPLVSAEIAAGTTYNKVNSGVDFPTFPTGTVITEY